MSEIMTLLAICILTDGFHYKKVYEEGVPKTAIFSNCGNCHISIRNGNQLTSPRGKSRVEE